MIAAIWFQTFICFLLDGHTRAADTFGLNWWSVQRQSLILVNGEINNELRNIIEKRQYTPSLSCSR